MRGGSSGTDDTVVRGTVLAFAARVAGGVCTGVLTVFLARKLGSAGFGVFALALSIEALLLLVSDFGVVQSLQRFIAEHRNDRAVLAELVGDAIRLKLLGTVVVGVALVVLAPVIAHAYGSPKLTWALRGVALTVLGTNFLLMSAGVFTALRRQAQTLMAFASESTMELSATVVLVLVFGGAVAAVVGRAIGYLFGAAVAFVLMVRLIGPGATRHFRGPRRHLRRIASDAGALLIVDSAYTLFAQVDSLLIGAYLTVTSVGIWQAPLRLIVLLVYPGQAIASAVVPRLVSSGQRVAEPETFARAVRLLVVLMAAVIAFTTAWATPVIQLVLGSSFARSADVLRALAPYIFLSGLGYLVSVGMNYLGQAKRRIPIAVFTALINVIIDLILIPRMGVIGGAIGTDVAITIYVPAHFYYCRQALDVPLRPILRTLVGSLVAGGAMSVVLVAAGTKTLGVAPALIGGCVGLGEFVAVLLLTQAVTREELSQLSRWVRGRRR